MARVFIVEIIHGRASAVALHELSRSYCSEQSDNASSAFRLEQEGFIERDLATETGGLEPAVMELAGRSLRSAACQASQSELRAPDAIGETANRSPERQRNIDPGRNPGGAVDDRHAMDRHALSARDIHRQKRFLRYCRKSVLCLFQTPAEAIIQNISSPQKFARPGNRSACYAVADEQLNSGLSLWAAVRNRSVNRLPR